jgi:hypothetical protein
MKYTDHNWTHRFATSRRYVCTRCGVMIYSKYYPTLQLVLNAQINLNCDIMVISRIVES